MADAKAPETKIYVLLSGKHFGRDPKDGTTITYKPGDEVPLTKEQYDAFKDKFEDPQATAAKAAEKKAARAAEIEAEKAAKAGVTGNPSAQ